MPDDAPVWQHATSTRENCLGQECPRYKDCFVMKARRGALAADVGSSTIIFSSPTWCCATRGWPSCCRPCNTLIFDEAHSCRIRRLFFGESVSTDG